MRTPVPGPLWLAIATMAVVSLLTLLSLFRGAILVPLVTVVCNLALLFGLWQGHKWAYVVTIVFSVLGALFAFGKGPMHGLLVLIGNGLVLVPVLLCTRYFFPGSERGELPPA